MNWLLYLLSLGAGALNPVQSGANAELRRQLGTVMWSGAVVYIVGLAGVLFLQLFIREAFPSADKLVGTHWWAWLGGLASIGSTLAGVALAQRLGAGIFTGLNITAALAASILFDHFGWVGFRVHPASPLRLLGCALMVGGLWMVAKF